MAQLKSPAELARIRQQISSRRAEKRYVAVNALGTCGIAYGSDKVFQAFVAEIERQGLAGHVGVRATGCLGFCENSPIVIIFPEETCYLGVKPDDVPEIVSKTILGKSVV